MRTIPFLIVLAMLLFGISSASDQRCDSSDAPQRVVAPQVSDAAKVKRLRSELTGAELQIAYFQMRARSFWMAGSRPPAALIDSLSAANTRRDLAQRNLNRFMDH
jgi:hypothetical protein